MDSQMKKIVDVLLVLGLLAAIGFFVYVQGGAQNGIQSLPSIAVVPTGAPTIAIASPAPILQSSIPNVSFPTSVLAPTSTFTPFPTATLKLTITPTSDPPGTATSTSLPTQAPVEQEIRQGIEQGNQIIQAIESFSQTQGYYPPALSDLVPNFLVALPVTAAGQPFYYRVFDRAMPLSGEIYWVAFKVTGQDHLTCTYFRRLQYWDCNVYSP
jgi:hypothetical protein